MGISSFLNRGVRTLATLAAGLCILSGSLTAQTNKVPVFQKEVFPKTHDSFAVDEIEFEVKKGVRYFTIEVNSIFPWICQGEIQNVYADDTNLASNGNTWFVRGNLNVYSVAIRYYVPSNRGYCSFFVKAFQ